MNACSLMYCLLLAQIHRFDGLRDRFSGPRSHFGTDDAITAILSILAFAVVLYFVNRWHKRFSGRQSYNSPWAMFRELCKAHNLDRKQRVLLKRVAQWQRLEHPARLFLEPERYEPVNLSPELEQFSAELMELRSKLFTFEVTPEAKDSQHGPTEVSHRQFERTSLAMSSGLQTEAVGAAAFATTRLDLGVVPSESVK